MRRCWFRQSLTRRRRAARKTMNPKEISALAPAKVNLFLHVGPVKTNGRHPLESLVVFAGKEAADRLRSVADKRLSLVIEGLSKGDPTLSEGNLVLKAAEALRAETGITEGAAFTLDKTLPVAAGIGGGSANAAATLNMLCELWGVDLAAARKVAPALGGDVPVALAGHASLMQGEGERVRRVTGLPQVPAVLVNAGTPCPTGPVFQAYDAAGGGSGFREFGAVPPFERVVDLVHWLGLQRNDLESPAIGLLPEIGVVLEVLKALPGVLLVRMSGSGATCFALFETRAEADDAAARLTAARPGWWVRATMLGDAT